MTEPVPMKAASPAPLELEIGSIWTVPDLGADALVMILAGPFRADSEHTEYLVAPIYRGTETGNRWTSEDVRVESAECGGLGTLYIAIWNSRPALAHDLGLQVALVVAEAVTAVRDAYWSNLNEVPNRKDPRLGPAVRSQKEEVARFQSTELKRWAALSGRALAAGNAPPAKETVTGTELLASVYDVVSTMSADLPSWVYDVVSTANADHDWSGEYLIPPGTFRSVAPSQIHGIMTVSYDLASDPILTEPHQISVRNYGFSSAACEDGSNVSQALDSDLSRAA